MDETHEPDMSDVVDDCWSDRSREIENSDVVWWSTASIISVIVDRDK